MGDLAWRPVYRGRATEREDVRRAFEMLGIQPGDLYYIVHEDALKTDSGGGARRSDPETSHRAAKSIEVTGENQRGLALLAIRSKQSYGMTAREVEEATGVDGIWRRISELHGGGFIIETGAERESRKSGKDQRVFVLTERGHAKVREIAMAEA